VFRINTADGDTIRLDPHDEEQAQRLLSLMKDHKFQEKISGITVLRRYTRRHRCPNSGCKRHAKLVCPKCGEIDDGYKFTYTGLQYTLARPDTFDKVSFTAEGLERDDSVNMKGGERLVCFAGDVQLTVMAHAQQPAARVTLRRIGKQRYNPLVE
jgi:hypothetical protein